MNKQNIILDLIKEHTQLALEAVNLPMNTPDYEKKYKEIMAKIEKVRHQRIELLGE